MSGLGEFIELALDLSAAFTASDRYHRVLEAVRHVVPCDAAALLRLDPGGELIAVATHGLADDVLGMSFSLDEHPRLRSLCLAEGVVCFPEDSTLPDPFDGLLRAGPNALGRVHACLGSPLRIEGQLVGVLTADALEPGAFAALDLEQVRALAALAAAAVRTSELLAALELRAAQQGIAPAALLGAARRREGVLIGRSAVMSNLRREIELVAPSDFPVLVSGETGAGKELVVRAIHEASPRRAKPLVYVNCAAVPESLFESELFGHVKGAFTGAHADRAGKLQLAHGGTLFLDEIGELPLALQPKLLRALQQGEVQRVGSEALTHVDVRVLAATNRDLQGAMNAGTFRADLYHRLAVYPLNVPPLRERREDVPALVAHFADVARMRRGSGRVRVTSALLDRLAHHAFPGNVRELENLVNRAVLRATARALPGEPVVVDVEDLTLNEATTDAEHLDMPPLMTPRGAQPSLRESIDEFQRALIRRTVADANGNWAEAARRLKVDRANLHHLAARLGLK